MAQQPALSELDVAQIRRFCAGRVPASLAGEVRIEHVVRGSAVTILELRAPWRPDLTEWSRKPVARLRYAADGLWRLDWADHNGRWHAYEAPATRRVSDLLDEIAADPTAIFWG